MTAIDFIKNQLKKMHSKFPNSNIRYEFRNSTKAHLIEVTPLEFYNSESYIMAELELEENFLIEFPNEEIVFISNESLNKICSPSFELYSEKTGGFRADFIAIPAPNEFHGMFGNVYEEENNYALAA